MPLVLMTGIPSSGKTTRALEIKKYFEELGKQVLIVSEEEEIKKAGFDKNAFYLDSFKEKHIRGLLKSEAIKLITPEVVVILDGGNYIKGYRYELYCASKNNKCTQCTVHTEINRDIAWDFNQNRQADSEKYSREVFDGLLMRYEEPDGRNRWDSPLFMIFPDNDLDLEAVSQSLFGKKAPRPNKSTQNPALTATNFLHDLDKIVQEITDNILKEKDNGATGEITIPGYGLTINVSNVSRSQLTVLRRQYIVYSRMHIPTLAQLPQLYVQYLRSSLGQ